LHRTLPLLLIIIAMPNWTWAQEYRLQLKIPTHRNLNDFIWNTSRDTLEPLLESRENEGALEYYVKLKGNFKKKIPPSS
jgi:hypothetical protein